MLVGATEGRMSRGVGYFPWARAWFPRLLSVGLEHAPNRDVLNASDREGWKETSRDVLKTSDRDVKHRVCALKANGRACERYLHRE